MTSVHCQGGSNLHRTLQSIRIPPFFCGPRNDESVPEAVTRLRTGRE